MSIKSKFELSYQASNDGFHSNDFPSRCDGIAHTLAVIKATSGNTFGGFTEQLWSSNGCYVDDKKAFIFSLVNKERKPFLAYFCPISGMARMLFYVIQSMIKF